MKKLLFFAMLIISVSAIGQDKKNTIPTGGHYKPSFGKLYPIYGDTTNGKIYYQRQPGVWFKVPGSKKRRAKI